MKFSAGQLFSCFILSLLFIAFNSAPVVVGVCCYPKRLWSTCPDAGENDPNTYYCNDCEVGTPYCGRMDCNIFGRLFSLLINKNKTCWLILIFLFLLKTCCNCSYGCRQWWWVTVIIKLWKIILFLNFFWIKRFALLSL